MLPEALAYVSMANFLFIETLDCFIYLAHFSFQGLIESTQKQVSESPDPSSLIQETVKASAPVEQKDETLLKPEESCPICHETLRNQKMVFQCGHTTCCNCKDLTSFIYSHI